MNAPWGFHLILDLADCDAEVIRSKERIREFVDTLCTKLEVKQFGPPQIVWFGSGRVSGFTFVQLIETSLVSGHLAEQLNAAFIDVFSCKFFDPVPIVAFSKHFFKATDAMSKFFERGLNV